MIIKHQFSRISLLITTIINSTIIILTSTNWIIIWLAIEINLISIIPLILASKISYETESSIKYFLIQATRSTLILTSITIYLSSSLKRLSTILLLARLIIKIGIAPFHLWLPQVLNGLTWHLIIIITTWQKLGPLLIISYIIYLWNPTILTIIVSIRAILGRLGGINQTQIRPLIAYSSISHIAWIVASSSLSHRITFLYFIFYSTITIILIIPIKSITKITTNKFRTSTQLSSNLSSSHILTLLSLGGIPPLLGFIPKWIVVLILSETNIIIPTILVLSSLIRLYYYLIVFFARRISTSKPLTLNHLPSSISLLIPINILPTTIFLTYL